MERRKNGAFLKNGKRLRLYLGESTGEGRGFESQQCILDGRFSHIFVVKILVFV